MAKSDEVPWLVIELTLDLERNTPKGEKIREEFMAYVQAEAKKLFAGTKPVKKAQDGTLTLGE